jgi:hypothetical protein
MWTDGQTGMTKLIVAFRNFPNAPKNKRMMQYRYTAHYCYLLILFISATNSGCSTHRLLRARLLYRYQYLRNGENNEACSFLRSISSVSDSCVSVFTFYHLVKMREIFKRSVPNCASVVRRSGGKLQHYCENFVVMLQPVISLLGIQI